MKKDERHLPNKEDQSQSRKLNFNIEIDNRSGMMVGRNPDTSNAQQSDSIEKGIFSALKTIGKKEQLLANEIEDAISASNHKLAADIVLSDQAQTALFFASGSNIFNAARKIDRNELETEQRQELLQKIVALASKVGVHGPVYEEIKELLKSESTLDDALVYSLKNMLALATFERGADEAALSIWKDLLSTADSIDAGERGWIHRNMAYALRNRLDERSQKSREQSLKFSFDAFLEAGDKRSAAQSLGQIAKIYESKNFEDAINKYDEMLDLINRKGVMDDEIRANIFHAKGKKLLEACRYSDAKHSALDAVLLRRGIVGVEESLMSSLNLAIIAANLEDDKETSTLCANEIEELERVSPSRHFALGNRITALMENYDSAVAEAVRSDADETGDLDLIAGANMASIMGDTKLSPVDKLSEFQTLHNKLEEAGAHSETLKPPRLAIATSLREKNDFDGATRWYKKILIDQPLDVQTGVSLINALWEGEQWGEAAIELASQIDRLGELPGYLYAYGRSLFEAGDMNGAVQAFTRSIKLSEPDSEIGQKSKELRESALELGGIIQIPTQPPTSNSIVSLEDVRSALNEFGQFVSSAKRMEFWCKPKGEKKHKWVTRPERFGQNLLHTFLQARFGRRTKVFEEISAGAGRLDIMAQFEGGLSVIIELKMCGNGYTTSYAQAGEMQVKHYMDNLNINTGFLVSFDARVRENGVQLLTATADSMTVCEVLIDLRPSVFS